MIEKKVKNLVIDQYDKTQKIPIKIANDYFLKRNFDEALKICKDIM